MILYYLTFEIILKCLDYCLNDHLLSMHSEVVRSFFEVELIAYNDLL
jgi:hypothetical protein